MQGKKLVVYSGGSDSFTVLHKVMDSGMEPVAISFAYGQRHSKELMFARAECAKWGIEHKVIDISFLGAMMEGVSALTTESEPVPEGHYEAENMKRTVVPNRNMVLLSIAGAFALSKGITVMAYGAHQGDHAIYPDCRPAFVSAMQFAFAECDWSPLILEVPFLHEDKRGIYTWGVAHGLDYARAWTCYNGRERACGRCGSCIERLMAFDEIGVEDPLVYEDRNAWRLLANANPMERADD